MYILSPETDNCPSKISRRERMTVEIISWSISTKECCQPRGGWIRSLLITSGMRIQLSHQDCEDVQANLNLTGISCHKSYFFALCLIILLLPFTGINFWCQISDDIKFCRLFFFFILTNYHLERRLYVKLKDWMSNSVDPDEMAHWAILSGSMLFAKVYYYRLWQLNW